MFRPVKSTAPVEDDPRGFNERFSRGLSRLLSRLRVQDVPHIKRIIVTVVGGTVLILGAALIFMPGQVLVILAGLAILGTEYAWARLLLRKGRQLASRALSQTQRMVGRRADLSGKHPVTGSPEPASAVASVKDESP